METLSEHEFMKLYHLKYAYTGIVDGGLFQSLGNDPKTALMTGSCGDEAALAKGGYRPTRIDKIVRDGFTVHVQHLG